MIRLILIPILLVGCSWLPQINPISSLFDECWFDESGHTEPPCIGGRPEMLLKHHWVEPIDDITLYDIDYQGQHTYREVRSICKGETGKDRPGCIVWSVADKTATIWYVYGDERAIKHERDHIPYGKYH